MEKLHQKLVDFFSNRKLRTYKRHDLILHEDDTPNGVYLIKKGYLRLYSISPDGEELTRLLLGPNDMFPLRWSLTEEPIDYYAEPLTDIEAWYAPKAEFLELVKSDIDLFMEVTHYIVHRMGTLYKRMEFLAFGDSYQKVAAIIVTLAKRFGTEKENGIHIEFPSSS